MLAAETNPNLSSQPDQTYCQHKKLILPGIQRPLSARFIAIAYAVFGLTWLFLINQLPGLQHSVANTIHLHRFAGCAFVLLTATLLYLLVRRYMADISCSHDLLTQVFEASPNAIAVIRDQDQKILLANKEFCRMSGYSSDALEGPSHSDLKLWNNKADHDLLLNRLQNESVIHGIEANFKRQDGSLFTGSVTALKINFNRYPCTVTIIEDTTLQKQIAHQVEELTRYDTITGLPNQRLLTDRMSQLLAISNREEQALAVLTLALGGCPDSLSAYGHDGYDDLLRSLTVRVRSALRETDTLATLQKGEFGILLPKIESEHDLLPVVAKLFDCICEPISLAKLEVQLHAHIGIAIFPSDGRTGEVLLQHAHHAMTLAQSKTGENHFQFYSSEMNKAAEEQLQVEASILQGIKAGEFSLCYQPLFDPDGKKLVSIEALARWQHPTLGLVGPDKFIPVAEENGAILALGDLILELALHNCQYWRNNGFPHVSITVNVSARQLKDRQFSERVARQLQMVGLPPDTLCCELTESVLMEHSNENTEQLFRLKELGVKLAIDNFGAGYSSLVHLKHLPVDMIKIDRSFIDDLESNTDDKAIVSAIVAMANSLHLEIVAVGVETVQQHQILQDLGCNLMQGYYFGKPMDRDQFEQFLHERSGSNIPAEHDDETHAESEKMLAAATSAVQAYEDRSLQTVADLTILIPPLQPGDRLNTVLDRFQTEKSLQALPVVDRQRVVGILNRSEFIEEQIVGRIGYAFHINHSKKVRDLMLPVPLVIDYEASIEEAALALRGNFGSMRLENICVAKRGVYRGILDARTLVEAITALNLKLAKGANPLTGLPGNESIQRETTRRLESGMPFDIAYIDIDHFKPYNDFYGFERGDMVIQVVGEILKLHTEKLLQSRQDTNFCGHIGGDDFIIITGPGHAATLSRQVIAEFDSRLPLLHGSSDHAKGCYTSFNRKGELETFSLLSLSVAVISTGQLQVSSYAQLASMASEVKKTAKKVKGSSVVLKDSLELPCVVQGVLAIDVQAPQKDRPLD